MRTRIIRAALAALVVALLLGAWQVAYARGRDDGRTEAAAIRAEFTQARQGAPSAGGVGSGTGAGGAAVKGGGGAGQRPAVAGTVEKVENGLLTVATEAGAVTVSTGERTQVRRQVSGSVADIKPGDRVVVTGEKRGETEYAAAAIQVQGQ